MISKTIKKAALAIQPTKLYQAAYEENQILAEIIKVLEWKSLQELLQSSPKLRAKCKCFDAKKVKGQDQEQIRQNLLAYYEKDSELKAKLKLCWDLQNEAQADWVRNYTEVEDLKAKLSEQPISLALITTLWNTRKKAFREVGDELFKSYLENTTDQREGVQIMPQGELFNKSLGQLMEEMSRHTERVNALEQQLAEKDQQIKELKQQVSYNKDLKKNIAQMSEQLTGLNQKAGRQETEQAKRLTEMENHLANLDKSFQRESKANLKESKDQFKHLMDEMNHQISKQVAKAISGDLKTLLTAMEALQMQAVANTEVAAAVNQTTETPATEKQYEKMVLPEQNKAHTPVSALGETLYDELERIMGI